VNRRREVGFWPLLADQSLRETFGSPEFLAAVVLGGGGAALMAATTTVDARIAVSGDVLLIAAALLGIVFAALALVVSLFSDSYLRLLNSAPGGGIRVFLAPFMIALGLQVGALLGAVTYRAAASLMPGWAEAAGFVLLALVFVWAVLDVVALARSVLLHALNRTRQAELNEL
jgi:hypothetical protein